MPAITGLCSSALLFPDAYCSDRRITKAALGVPAAQRVPLLQ